MSFETDGSNVSQPVSMPAYLEMRDDQHFKWDDTNRELSDPWTQPVLEAGLDPTRHKVFRHGDKEYLNPPAPFLRHGPDLGESGSTVVYRVRPPESTGYTRTLALKAIVCKEERRHPGPDSRARRLALTEVRNMSKIRHPHIVVYVASFEDYCIQAEQSRRHVRGGVKFVRREQIKKHILCIAMYPAAAHNLHTFMNELIEFPVEDGWKAKYMYAYFGCLAQAVTYLHKSTVQIRHKDIKPENIVIDDFGMPVLTDFGLSKHFETGKHSEGPTLKTTKYADPEATHETQRDVRSDVFSLGSVYLELVTVLLGKKPSFAEQNLRDPTIGEFRYADCPEKLADYLSLLRSIGEELVAQDFEKEQPIKALLDVLPHISSMMNEDHAKRPYANDLFPLFRPLYDVYEEPGLCEHCERESFLNSGSSSPTTIKTNRSSTMSSSNSGMAGV
ncbi:kinase-like protein [Thozetella sp. PMI_491]|nr:kinase-like protein [Thozetella sp. PMI_491]